MAWHGATITHSSYVDSSTNRLGAVRVAGLDMSSDVSGAVSAASMSFSSTQVGQFSLTITDTADAFLTTSGMFGPGTTIDWGDQHLEVRTIDFTGDGPGGPKLTVKARSRVISALRGPSQQGKTSWGSMDVTTWVYDRCYEVGATPVIQGGLGSLTFARAQTEGSIDTTWDVMVAAAKNVGCWCWESEQVIYFGRPSFLADPERSRTWDLRWNNRSDYSPGMTGLPSYSWSADSNPPGDESLTFGLISGDADVARPGDRVNLGGNVGMANGLWLMSDVTLPLSITAPVKVTCRRVVDPPLVAQRVTA